MTEKKTTGWGHRLREENRGLKGTIAALKKENAVLRKDLEKTWDLMDHVPGGLFLLQQEEIIYANKSACEWLGYSLGQLAGKPISDVIDPAGIRSVLEFIRDETGNQGPDALYFKDRGGKRVVCAAHLKKTRYGGKKALLLNMIEINRKMEQEKEVIRAQKVEALKRMAGIFVQKSEIDPKSGPPFSACLKDFAKQSHEPSEISPLNLNKIIEASISQCCSEKKIDLRHHDPADRIRFITCLNALSPIRGSKRDLKRAFVNLLANAVEALEGKGEIYLTTEEKPGMINVYVQENGIGIPENMLEKIFDPFFTTKGNGHEGMGLSRVQAIIARHGGIIKVVQHEAQGTTFHMKLPLDRHTSERNERFKKKPLKNTRILLVGDENLLNNLLCRFLANKGINMTLIDSHGESLKALKGASFDLMLTDQSQKPANALWMIRKAIDINPNMPIVMFNVSKAEYSNLSKEPAVSLPITRPLHMDQLFSLISSILADGKGRQRIHNGNNFHKLGVESSEGPREEETTDW